jgi:hypothetical protein
MKSIDELCHISNISKSRIDKIQGARKYFVIKKTHKANLHQKRTKGILKARWKDDVENDINTMGIVNWRQVAQDKYGRREQLGTYLSFLNSGAIEEDEEEEE